MNDFIQRDQQNLTGVRLSSGRWSDLTGSETLLLGHRDLVEWSACLPSTPVT